MRERGGLLRLQAAAERLRRGRGGLLGIGQPFGGQAGGGVILRRRSNFAAADGMAQNPQRDAEPARGGGEAEFRNIVHVSCSRLICRSRRRAPVGWQGVPTGVQTHFAIGAHDGLDIETIALVLRGLWPAEKPPRERGFDGAWA